MDLLSYERRDSGATAAVPEGTPVACPGFSATAVVVAAFDDFLGRTVVLEHGDTMDASGRTLHSALGHVESALAPGDAVHAGEIVGTVAGARAPPAPAPHLHVTLAWAPRGTPLRDWRALAAYAAGPPLPEAWLRGTP